MSSVMQDHDVSLKKNVPEVVSCYIKIHSDSEVKETHRTFQHKQNQLTQHVTSDWPLFHHISKASEQSGTLHTAPFYDHLKYLYKTEIFTLVMPVFKKKTI